LTRTAFGGIVKSWKKAIDELDFSESGLIDKSLLLENEN